MWLSELRKGQKVTYLAFPQTELTGVVLGWDYDTVYIRDPNGVTITKALYAIRPAGKPLGPEARARGAA